MLSFEEDVGWQLLPDDLREDIVAVVSILVHSRHKPGWIRHKPAPANSLQAQEAAKKLKKTQKKATSRKAAKKLSMNCKEKEILAMRMLVSRLVQLRNTGAPVRAMSGPAQMFDRGLKRKHKSRAAVSPRSAEFDYLRDEVADRLTDRLHDITRDFPHALDLGANNGHVLRTLGDGRGGIKRLVMAEESQEALDRDNELVEGIEVEKVRAVCSC